MKIINEIVEIAEKFESGECETPGGLEHMGDVRQLFLKWKDQLEEAFES
ncbi:MAG: hypothetical protein OEY77_00045 [Nitrospira sp.]|nr:hypothetical protein [Nitrospira sp.]